MKTILSVIFAAVALLALPTLAQAQYSRVYGPQPLTLRTNYIGASTATNYNLTIDCAGQRNVTLMLHQQNDDSGTANLTYVFYGSLDNSTFATAPTFSVALAANGTTAVNTLTNIDTLGYGYLRLGYITNAAASANCTNVSVSYGLKLGAN